MFYEFHQRPQPYDDLMDAELHEQYARVLREQSKYGYFNWKTAPDGTPRPVFSPSSASKTERELYEKARKSARDPQTPTPNQRDWTGLGSQVGDYIQREVLLIERHFGEDSREISLNLDLNGRNETSLRLNVSKKKMHEVSYGEEKFAIHGLPDGILIYTADDGQEYRVGLEVKSFQKSYVDFKKVVEPKKEHVEQSICYSEMYGLDYYIVIYHLTYGVKWDKEINRNKVFGIEIRDEDRARVFEKLRRVTRAVRLSEAPSIDLFEWAFYEYKRSTAKNLTDGELADLYDLKSRMMRTRLPDWKKRRLVRGARIYRESTRRGGGSMTVDEVKERVDDIRHEAGDDETAHGMEDDLYIDVSEAIANGADNPEKLAAEALKTPGNRILSGGIRDRRRAFIRCLAFDTSMTCPGVAIIEVRKGKPTIKALSHVKPNTSRSHAHRAEVIEGWAMLFLDERVRKPPALITWCAKTFPARRHGRTIRCSAPGMRANERRRASGLRSLNIRNRARIRNTSAYQRRESSR
ncbi:hypothetical protein [Bacillus pumilus]|uniref:hypothetical protein n=1 Tax=Bacillus pumilus TaxID=1408 RepID=UPI003CE7BF84